jgi:hypothetical protein
MASYKCPACGSEALVVTAEVEYRLVRADNALGFELQPHGEPEWNEYSSMRCEACDLADDADLFAGGYIFGD